MPFQGAYKKGRPAGDDLFQLSRDVDETESGETRLANESQRGRFCRRLYARFNARRVVPFSRWIFSCSKVNAYISCSGRGGHPGT